MQPFSLPHLGRFGEVLGDLGGGETAITSVTSVTGEDLERGGTAPSTQKAAALPSSSHPVKRNEARGEAEQIGRGIWKLRRNDGAGEAVRSSAGHRSGSAPLPDRGGCAAGLLSLQDESQSPGPLPP